MEEAVHMWGQWVYRTSLYLPLSFVVTLKLLFLKKVLIIIIIINHDKFS